MELQYLMSNGLDLWMCTAPLSGGIKPGGGLAFQETTCLKNGMLQTWFVDQVVLGVSGPCFF